MKDDLAARLRRLGLAKGPGALRPPEDRRPAKRVENLLRGELYAAGDRACFVVEESFPLDTQHGGRSLGALLDQSIEVAATLAQDPALARLRFSDLLFIDTETTGLSGGTGTLVFLVGIGYFEGERFLVTQYFLRSPADEPAMLAALGADVARRPGLVSFNGRSFDIPLLETRYILNRQRPPFIRTSHLDLLPPARRLWRDSLDSCSLGSLEGSVLGVRRDQADVPGGLIPVIYRDYLRSGNAIEMPRIFYHNQIDVLSMVVLAAHLCSAFGRPEGELQRGQEWFSLARWYEQSGMIREAEGAYRSAIDADLPAEVYRGALQRLGLLLKRSERRAEAEIVWQQLASVELDDVHGHIELAKYHEWHTGELEQAAEWTRQALVLVEHWPRGLQKLVTPELHHRLNRLETKLERRSTSTG
jgi:uncharacterized protein YprB with RNaseH-like and TPR domain